MRSVFVALRGPDHVLVRVIWRARDSHGDGHGNMVERLVATMGRSREAELSFRAWARRLISELAILDWGVLIYLSVLSSSVLLFAAPGLPKEQMLMKLGALIGVFVTVIVLVRGSLLRNPLLAAICYRLATFGVVLGSYFLLRGLLPMVSARAYDAQLYHLDLRVFGFEPSLVMDRYVNAYTTEWFAFFYYLYFAVLAVHAVPFTFLGRNTKLLAEFAFGITMTYCIAHSVYMLVPGFGPYRYLAAEFHHPLVSGFWMDRVLEAVNSAGAQKDIFPSLHTAGPLFILLFSFRNRRNYPFRYTWPVTAFIVVNIIIATMFLRWHYLIDIIAGITLAFTNCYLLGWVQRKETARRELAGLQPVFPPLWPAPVAEPDPERAQSPTLRSAQQ